MARNEVSHPSSLGLGLRTWILLAASKELNIFCSNSPQRHVLVLTIFGGKESEVQCELFAASREMKGGKLVGGGAFSIQNQMLCLHSIQKKGKKKRKRKNPRTKRSCFHSFVELNHIINLYVCTAQIFVFWSFITFTLASAPTAEAQVTLQDRTEGSPQHPGSHCKGAQGREGFSSLALQPKG